MRQRTLALIVTCAAGPLAGGELVETGRIAVNPPAVAGLSGIEVTADGSAFTAISDKGWWVTGTIDRNGETLAGVEFDTILPIIGMDGFPVAARRAGDWSDAEGLALAEDGTAWVAFERWTHVWEFPDPQSPGQFIKDHPTFREMTENWQLEAAAISPEGQVIILPEKPLLDGFPVYRLEGKGWVIDGYLPEQDVFSIVGADFDTNGDLYLLERRLVVGIWWQAQIRRVRLDGSMDVTLWTGELGEYDNLEGLALWRDDEGLRLLLVSDNNGTKDTPTEFVEFRLVE